MRNKRTREYHNLYGTVQLNYVTRNNILNTLQWSPGQCIGPWDYLIDLCLPIKNLSKESTVHIVYCYASAWDCLTELH